MIDPIFSVPVSRITYRTAGIAATVLPGFGFLAFHTPGFFHSADWVRLIGAAMTASFTVLLYFMVALHLGENMVSDAEIKAGLVKTRRPGRSSRLLLTISAALTFLAFTVANVWALFFPTLTGPRVGAALTIAVMLFFGFVIMAASNDTAKTIERERRSKRVGHSNSPAEASSAV